jgi:hypothetical protein
LSSSQIPFASQLRSDGEILFDSSYYVHLNEVGAIVAQSVASRYAGSAAPRPTTVFRTSTPGRI